MLIRKLCLLIIYLICGFTVAAQNNSVVSGSVKDSTGRPIHAASVSIITANGAGIAFSKTNAEGVFSCKFTDSAAELYIKVTALGYDGQILPLSKSKPVFYTIQLKLLPNQLKEVTIKSDNKILLASDTIKYRVDAFKEKNDRVILDLLNRLPGIQVDEKGVISYNGKRISTVYLDGDNLLNGRYGLATNNVPIGAVEQVQVIERDQPIKALNGYSVTNNVSLNLKLSEQARTLTLNTANVGLGNKAYTGDLNNLVFQKHIKSINNLKANNIGMNLERENAELGASNNDDETIKTPQPYLSMGSENEPNVAERYYLMNEDFLGTLNGLLKLNNDWSLRLNVASLQLRRKYNFETLYNYYFSPADTIRYNELQNHVQQFSQWQFQLQAERNSSGMYLKSITEFKIPKWSRTGITTQNQDTFEQMQPTSSYSLSNETSTMKAVGKNLLLQYFSVVQTNRSNESLVLLPGLHQEIVNAGETYPRLEQQLSSQKFFLRQSATLKAKFNRVVLSAMAGIFFERNQLHSILLKTDSNRVESLVGERFQNNNRFDNLKFFNNLSIIYKLTDGTINVEATPSFQHIGFTGQQNTPIQQRDYFLINPSVEYRKSFQKYHEIILKYDQHTQLGQINDVYRGTILINYRQFNFNDSPLPKTDLNNLTLRYSYRKPITMLFYNSTFNYENTYQNYISMYTLDSGLTRSSAIDFNNRQHRYNLNGSLSKYLFNLATNVALSGNLARQKGNVFYNNEISSYKSYNASLSLTLRKKVFPKTNLAATGNLAGVFNRQKPPSSAIIRNSTKINGLKVEWQQDISDALRYEIIYQWNAYKQSAQQIISNKFIDVKLKYSPVRWKGYFEICAFNLLNQNQYEQITSASNQLVILQTPLRSRTLLVNYSFSF